MQYKYYIYRQASPTNFDKYDLDSYLLFRELTPTGQWGVKIDRDKDFWTVVRRNFNGAISISGDDYTAMIATEGDTYQYAIVIHRYCAGAHSEFWKGYFSYFDFKVDRDKCTLNFEPKVWDKYSALYDQMNIERNAVAAGDKFYVSMDAFAYPTESIQFVFIAGSHPTPTYHEYNQIPVPVPNKYYLFSQDSIKTSNMLSIYTVTRIYRREYAYAADDITPPAGFAANGVPAEEVQPGLWKWVRPVGDMVYTTYSWVVNGDNAYAELDLPATGSPVGFNGNVNLNDVLDMFADFAGLNYASHFFQDDPCPMGGETLELTKLLQISNVRDTSEAATKGMLKLKDLLTMIRDTFNVFWYVDSSGDFRLEHRKYFEYGLSYTFSPVIELDLTAVYPVNTLHMNQYEWSTPELYRWEKQDFAYSYFMDWTEAAIEYPQLSILNNDTKSTSIDWGTDIVSMYEQRADLPTKGWVLLNVNLRGSHGIFMEKVINTIGAISGIEFQNARFSPANLMRDLWTYGRLLPSGKVNGVSRSFNTVARLRKQIELTIPLCCQDIDFEGLFRTELGDGILDSGEYEAKSGNLKMNLIYE